MRDVLGNHSLLILKFPYSSQLGGGEKHTLLLTDYLLREGWQVWCVTSCRVLREEFHKRGWSAHRAWAAKEPVAPWSLALFPLAGIHAFFALSLILLWHRARHGVRAVYCLSLTEKVLVTPVARLLGMRVYWVEHQSFGDWMKRNPLRLLYRLWSRFATVIAVSQHLAADVRAVGVREENIAVILNGVDIDLPRRVATERVMRFPKQFTIGVVARLHHEKGIEYLLKAVAIAKETVPQIRLVVVGEGPERRRLEWLAKKLDIDTQTHFTGFMPDVYPWLLGMDIFVLPSAVREPFGMVLAQAMSCRLPCISTTIGGIPEVVADGQTGFLVPPADARAIAEKIIHLYFHQDVRLAMGRAGYDRVQQLFTEQRMLQDLRETLQRQ